MAEAPRDPDEREAFFLALCCLEIFGELPVKEPLWQRALRKREKEQARERDSAERGRKREERRAAKRAAMSAATKATREQKRAALDGEVLAFIQSETAQGRPVLCSELAVMLGLTSETVRVILERLVKANAVEVRRPGGPRPATYWALSEAAPLLPVEAEPTLELPSEALPEAEETPAIPLEPALAEEPAHVTLEPLTTAAEEPSAPPPAPAPWPHRRLNAKRLHVSFPAVDLAMFAPPSADSEMPRSSPASSGRKLTPCPPATPRRS